MPETFAVPAAARPTVAVAGQAARFPVHRIYCVGRNYPEHSREMGAHDLRAPPFFFSKPADAVIESGVVLPYPARTRNLHHEVELVAALGSGGRDLALAAASACVYGYSVGLDLTRRDVQAEMKERGRPWDVAKGFDHSAALAPIVPASQCGHPASGRIWLEVNGELRQDGDLSQMIWSVPEIIAELSTWFELAAGDLVFTGTPAGVGPLRPGDRIRGGVERVAELAHTMAAG